MDKFKIIVKTDGTEMTAYRPPSESLLKREFSKLKNPVKIFLFFSSEEDSNYPAVLAFLNAIVDQADEIELQSINKTLNPEIFEKHQIEESPAIFIEDSGILYTGVPSGPESVMFIQTMVMKSTETTGIGEVIRKILSSLTKPVKIRTIVTSNCTICPLAVKVGNMMALESAISGNGKVRHEIIEALDHADYVSNYDLSSVPIIVINNKVAFMGIPDIDQYVLKLAEAGK